MIHEIYFDNQEFKIKLGENRLEDLRKINFFIGANGTGKSRFLRYLVKNFSNNNLKYIKKETKQGIVDRLNKIFKVKVNLKDLNFNELGKLINKR